MGALCTEGRREAFLGGDLRPRVVRSDAGPALQSLGGDAKRPREGYLVEGRGVGKEDVRVI